MAAFNAKVGKGPFTDINIFMSVEIVHFPLTLFALLRVYEENVYVESIVKNRSIFSEILRTTEAYKPRWRKHK
jgi:hypothetical protein